MLIFANEEERSKYDIHLQAELDKCFLTPSKEYVYDDVPVDSKKAAIKARQLDILNRVQKTKKEK